MSGLRGLGMGHRRHGEQGDAEGEEGRIPAPKPDHCPQRPHEDEHDQPCEPQRQQHYQPRQTQGAPGRREEQDGGEEEGQGSHDAILLRRWHGVTRGADAKG